MKIKKILMLSLSLFIFVIACLCLDGLYKLKTFEQAKNNSFSRLLSSCEELGVFDNRNDYQTNKNWLKMEILNSIKGENPTCINHFCFFDSSFDEEKYKSCKILSQQAQEYWPATHPYLGKPVDNAVNAAGWASLVLPVGEVVAAMGIGEKSYQLYKASKLTRSSAATAKALPLRNPTTVKAPIYKTVPKEKEISAPKGKNIRFAIAGSPTKTLSKKELIHKSVPVIVLGSVVAAGSLLYIFAKAALAFLSTHKIIILGTILFSLVTFIAIKSFIRAKRKKAGGRK